MTARRLAAVAAFALLVPVATAHARPVVITTTGEAVNVTADARGTVHIAYNDRNEHGIGEPLMYCAWPRGAKHCTPPRAILTDDESPLAQPPLLKAGPAPGQLAIASARDSIDVVRSANGGATWSGPVSVGKGRWFGGSIGPAGQLALSFPNLDYVEYYARSLAGSPASTGLAHLNQNHSANAVTGWAGNTPVLVSGGGNIHTAVSSWSGHGNIQDPATWIGPFRTADTPDFDLATGKSGLWLVYTALTHTGDNRIYARRFSLKTRHFGRRHAIPFGRLGLPDVVNIGLGQAANGRLVAAWYDSPDDRIEISASRNGKHWTRARVLSRRVTLPFNIRVGLGPSGRGLVVWDDNGDHKIKAAKVSAPALLRRR